VKDAGVEYCALYSIQGVLLHKERITNDNIEIDISSYPSGMYIVTLSGDQQVYPLLVAIK
jgi:hypothetical protein